MIIDALGALSAGYVAPILQRKKGRRRAQPHRTAQAERELLVWIRYQHGFGRRVADAEAEVANATGCTREAIAKWPRELAKVYGKGVLHTALALAEEVGRIEASGANWEDYDILAFHSAPYHFIWLTFKTLKRELAPLAQQRREATAKRLASRPKE
jgi:hypothetical protein